MRAGKKVSNKYDECCTNAVLTKNSLVGAGVGTVVGTAVGVEVGVGVGGCVGRTVGSDVVGAEVVVVFVVVFCGALNLALATSLSFEPTAFWTNDSSPSAEQKS